ncbi:MAG: cytidylate kinase-like family protein [bacterium]
MNHLIMIRQFLCEKRELDDLPDYGFPFITISRQPGAGGMVLSNLLMTEFRKLKERPLFEGWHPFNKEVCELVARDPLLQNDIEALMGQQHRSEFNAFVESLFTGRSDSQDLERTTFKVVRMLALIGKVILIGRGGALVTADLQQGVHIRLVAPEAYRIVRIMKRYKVGREEAAEVIEQQDLTRRKLIKLFFHRDIEDPLLYDVVWNTGKTGLDIMIRSTIELVQQHARPHSLKMALD